MRFAHKSCNRDMLRLFAGSSLTRLLFAFKARSAADCVLHQRHVVPNICVILADHRVESKSPWEILAMVEGEGCDRHNSYSKFSSYVAIALSSYSRTKYGICNRLKGRTRSSKLTSNIALGISISKVRYQFKPPAIILGTASLERFLYSE